MVLLTNSTYKTRSFNK